MQEEDRLRGAPLQLVRLAALLCLVAFVGAVLVGYEAMRDVMVDSGGFCASGGPYEIANECDDGIALRLTGSIFGGLFFASCAAALNAWARGPHVGLFFPLGAVFALLGWNFIDLGFGPPADAGTGTVWGWVACGLVFWAMALGFMAPATVRFVSWLRRGRTPEPLALDPELVRSVFGQRRR